MAQVLHVTTCDVTIFKRARQLCGLTGFLPTSYIIPEEFIQMAEYPITFGIFGDVWEGIYNDNRVTIKTFRLYKESDLRKVRKVTHPVFQVILGTSFDSRNQRFCKEVVIWRRISHSNIVAFLGVSEAPAPLSMVSEWMPNGNVREYVGKNPETSRLQLVCSFESARAQANANPAARHQPRFDILALLRDRLWRFERGAP